MANSIITTMPVMPPSVYLCTSILLRCLLIFSSFSTCSSCCSRFSKDFFLSVRSESSSSWLPNYRGKLFPTVPFAATDVLCSNWRPSIRSEWFTLGCLYSNIDFRTLSYGICISLVLISQGWLSFMIPTLVSMGVYCCSSQLMLSVNVFFTPYIHWCCEFHKKSICCWYC
jgi:hypothetical protein